MKKLILKLLPYIALCFPSNYKEGRQNYPQLWWIVSRYTRYPLFMTKSQWNKRRAFHAVKNCCGAPLITWRRRFIQWLCGVLTGHEISKTEWGYGGGKFVDCNCRWCDKLIKIHKEESKNPPKPLEGMAEELGFYT